MAITILNTINLMDSSNKLLDTINYYDLQCGNITEMHRTSSYEYDESFQSHGSQMFKLRGTNTSTTFNSYGHRTTFKIGSNSPLTDTNWHIIIDFWTCLDQQGTNTTAYILSDLFDPHYPNYGNNFAKKQHEVCVIINGTYLSVNNNYADPTDDSYRNDFQRVWHSHNSFALKYNEPVHVQLGLRWTGVTCTQQVSKAMNVGFIFGTIGQQSNVRMGKTRSDVLPVTNIYKGEYQVPIDSIYVGDKKVKQIYLGNNIIYGGDD